MDWRSILALALALLVGCATAPARPELRAGTPLVVSAPPPHATPPPRAASDRSLMLVNPLACGSLMVPPGADPFFVFLALLCVPVLGAIDLIALPFLAADSGDGGKAASTAARPCDSSDPAGIAADRLADGLAEAHGLVRAAALGPEAPGAVALRLVVETTDTSRSSDTRWSGRARLVDPEGSTIWEAGCDAEIPHPSTPSIGDACDPVRRGAEALGGYCARRWLDALSPGSAMASRS